MIEIPEPELTRIIEESQRKGVDIYRVIEFIGETAVWLEGNKPGKRYLAPNELGEAAC